MRRVSTPGLLGLAVLLIALAGCARAPYIYKEAEFDRSRPDFAKGLSDRDDLQICYAAATTTPQDLLAIAHAECGRFGKDALFDSQDTLICPIWTPARAKFRCVAR